MVGPVGISNSCVKVGKTRAHEPAEQQDSPAKGRGVEAEAAPAQLEVQLVTEIVTQGDEVPREIDAQTEGGPTTNHGDRRVRMEVTIPDGVGSFLTRVANPPSTLSGKTIQDRGDPHLPLPITLAVRATTGKTDTPG